MSAFKERALGLRAKGYRIVPIKHGRKGPEFDDWQKLHASEAQIRRWADGDYTNGNVGIIAENTPGVDVDVYNAEVAQQMEEWLLREFGDTPVRVGLAPKRLLLYRTDKPFRKMSCGYNDGKTEHRVEILGHGQQFVAYGVHPDTKREYTWTSLDEPLSCRVDELPLLTAADGEIILDKFEALAQAKGWKKTSRTGSAREVNDEDGVSIFERFKPILAITEERVLDTLDYIVNDDADYDTYLLVGCALHHQFHGQSRGLELWHEWASKSSKYIAADANRRWESMGHGPESATFATLIYMANEARRDESEKAFEKALNRVNIAPDTKLLFGDVIKSLAAHATTDMQCDIACKRLQDRAQELTQVKPRLETIRKQFNAAKPRLEIAERQVPKWCEDWAFVTRFGEFFNFENGQRLTRQNFDSAFGRMLLDDIKRANGESFNGRASDVALNLHEIPQVYDYVYLPGDDRFVQINRSLYINTYNANSLPASKQPLSSDDYLAIHTVEKHFELLFPDRFERETFLDFLAYNVQFPREKITWAVLIQGIDGAGKSWFASLMAACIGGENVRNVPGVSLQENYTSWAEGRKMVFIEEVRMHGNNKFEILDKIKPTITNPNVTIRRMRTDGYEVPNVTNYVMFTNHPDALPVDRGDRRYFVLRTLFQTASHIQSFNAANPEYFSDLFNVLSFNGDVIRHWFLTRRISDSFKAKGHAPDTEAKELMRDHAESTDDMRTLEEALNDGDPQLCDNVVNSQRLREHGIFGALPRAVFGQLLRNAGFAAIGKFRIGGNSKEPLVTYYTRHSELFPGDNTARLRALRDMIEEETIDDGF